MTRPSTAASPRPGDVQNGHVLTDNGQWVPTSAVPGKFRLSTVPMSPPKNKHTVGNVILVVLTLGVIGVGSCTALVVGGLGAASKTIEVDPQIITAVLGGWLGISIATAAAYAGFRELVKRARSDAQ